MWPHHKYPSRSKWASHMVKKIGVVSMYSLCILLGIRTWAIHVPLDLNRVHQAILKLIKSMV